MILLAIMTNGKSKDMFFKKLIRTFNFHWCVSKAKQEHPIYFWWGKRERERSISHFKLNGAVLGITIVNVGLCLVQLL